MILRGTFLIVADFLALLKVPGVFIEVTFEAVEVSFIDDKFLPLGGQNRFC